MGGKLVYSYCTSWRERTNWPSYGGISEAPSACSICYMTTDTPLAPDSWTYKGEYFANPGTFGYPYGNNHSHLQNSVMLITFFTTRKDWNNKWPSTEVTVA